MPTAADLLRHDTLVTLLGGGRVDPADLTSAIALAPALVAADGGADTALAFGHRPVAVVGDFDSLGPRARAELPPEALFHVPEQESTDFEKALSRIVAPAVLALGLTGGRTDHELAAWHTLMRCPTPPCIVIAEEDIVFLAPLSLTLDLPAGTRVSLFPLAPVNGTSRGLHWPIDGIAFAPGRAIGTSNRSDAPRVSLTLSARAMLVILPKAHLPAALAALV